MEYELKPEMSVCRGCLSSGRMYSLREHQLSDIYRTLIGENMYLNDALPQHLCHMCRGLLLKYAQFKQRCLESQNILVGLIGDNLELTPNNINPKKVKLPSYVTTETETTQYPDIHEAKIVQVLISRTHIEYDDVKVKHEQLSSPVSLKCDEDSITSDTEDISSKTADVASNLKKEKQIHLEKEVEDECGSKKRSNKRKQGFQMKGKYFETKENITTFEKLYDVKIVILSKEQQMKDVLERKSSFNYQNSPFKCEECYRGFIDEDNLAKHYKAQHDPSRGDIVCEFCQYRCTERRGLTRHLKSHRMKIVCRQCDHVSRNTFNAKEHYKMHTGSMHECRQCGKSYEKMSSYLSHVRLCHSEELSWCQLCGESFIGDIGLNGHVKKSHRDLKLTAQCARCGARFVSSLAHESHAAQSRDSPCDQLSSCAHCGRAFASPDALRQHLLGTHKKTVKNYQCCKCNKQFSRESLYSAHYRRIHANDPARRTKHWVCEVCGKTLPNKCRLMYHQRNHTGERPYQCPDCPKSFTLNKLLRSHSRVHSSERPFVCKYCPKTFKGPAALRGHEIVHHDTGERVKVSRKRKLCETSE